MADRYIAEAASAGDVAITADIPLAANLVEKPVVVLDPRGAQFAAEIIRGRLSIRDFMDSLRSSGVGAGGPRPFGPVTGRPLRPPWIAR